MAYRQHMTRTWLPVGGWLRSLRSARCAEDGTKKTQGSRPACHWTALQMRTKERPAKWHTVRGRIARRHGPGKVHARDLDEQWPQDGHGSPRRPPALCLSGIILGGTPLLYRHFWGFARDQQANSGTPLRSVQALIFVGDIITHEANCRDAAAGAGGSCRHSPWPASNSAAQSGGRAER